MRVAKDNSLMFNSSKYNVKSKSVNFFRAISDDQWGVSRPKKSRGHQSSETPSQGNRITLLGMFTYMGSFIPRLSEHTASLCNLLKIDT